MASLTRVVEKDLDMDASTATLLETIFGVSGCAGLSRQPILLDAIQIGHFVDT